MRPMVVSLLLPAPVGPALVPGRGTGRSPRAVLGGRDRATFPGPGARHGYRGDHPGGVGRSGRASGELSLRSACGSAACAAPVTGRALPIGRTPSRWAHRSRTIGSSPGAAARDSSAISSRSSGSRAPSAATRRTRRATARPVTKYALPASRKVFGGSPRNPAQSSTDLARPFRGPSTRQVSCRVTSATVNPGTATPSRWTGPRSSPGTGPDVPVRETGVTAARCYRRS